MLCNRCGSPLNPGTAFCPSCGATTGLAQGGAPLARPRVVTLLAVLQFVSGAALLAVGLLGSNLLGTGSAPSPLVAGALAVLGLAQLTCGIGLWRLQPFGRTLQIVLAVIGLLGFPVGTVLYGLVLWLFSKPGAKVLFSGRSAPELSEQEAAEVREFSGSGLATVVSVLIVLVVLIVPLAGILAAVAIPGLMRARMAGNEASAVAAVRSVVSAQLTFSATCGHGYYAADLASLSVPEPGGMTFVSPDLSTDPSFKSGYTVALAGGPVADAPPACNGGRVVQNFFVLASPLEPGITGSRYFGANQDGTLYQSSSSIPVTFGGAPPGAIPLQ